VWASGLPQSVFGRFRYGDVATPPAAMGDGFLCRGGTVVGIPVVLTGLDDVARQPIDNSALQAGGGALLPGTTWNFQFIHRDATSFGTGFNDSPALSIAFSS